MRGKTRIDVFDGEEVCCPYCEERIIVSTATPHNSYIPSKLAVLKVEEQGILMESIQVLMQEDPRNVKTIEEGKAVRGNT